ncbi:MAG TPA: hypothetical protein VN700_01510 [Vicinamibacterales bacterium]|nr:hypothetical protein [Vicinamibacterales bacterium]
MQRIADALGIDYPVFRALVHAWLRMSFRSTAASANPNAAAARGLTLAMNALMYLVIGLGLGFLCFLAPDKLGAATLTSSFVMVIVGSMVLLDHASVMTSPTDHVILGWRPISSRTYFAARVAVILIYTIGLALFAGFGPVVGFLVSSNRLTTGLAAGGLVLLSAVFASLVIVFSYAWVLRAVGPDRLKRALTYLQLGASFAIYGGYMLPNLFFDKVKPGALSLPESAWLLLYPPFWFASYVAVAAGNAGTREYIGAALTLAAIAAAVFSLSDRVSLDYSDRLGGLFASTARAKARPGRRPWVLRSGDARAMTVLIRAQFRHDQAFRMQILAFIPIVLMYFLMALREGVLPDPYARTTFDSIGWMFIGMTVIMVGAIFQGALPRSEAYKASWIYFAAPIDRSRLLRATKIVFVVRILIPATAAIASVAIALSGFFWHSVVHFTILGLVALALLQVNQLIEPELPFSLERSQTVRNTGRLTVVMLVTIVGGTILSPVLTYLVYPDPIRVGVSIGGLALANVALDWLTRARVQAGAEGLEFSG